MIDFVAETEIIKALGDPTRLKIIDLLSCGEMCACNILLNLSITQPTLSHHMKVLMDCGIVSGRKDSVWMYYSICHERVSKFHEFIDYLTHPKDDCACNPYRGGCCSQ